MVEDVIVCLIKVDVIEALQLPAMDLNGKADPVRFHLTND
jgi:hypothetical protein